MPDHCIHNECETPDNCCRQTSYMPRGVDEYRNFIRRETGGLVGGIPNTDGAAMYSFYSNLAYSLQFLEYIYNDIFIANGRGVHPVVSTQYIKTFYAVAFSVIESVLLAKLKKHGVTPRNPRDNRPSDSAEAIIATAHINQYITPTLATELEALRDKRNKIHLSKIFRTTGVAAFNEHDWNAFGKDELDAACKGLYNLILERSALTATDATVERLFGYLNR